MKFILFILAICACVGACKMALGSWRWLCAKFGGIQTVRVKVTVPTNRGVKRDVDDMMLHDEVVGEPEEQVGEY